jgi:SAM-dependent methyltransferase
MKKIKSYKNLQRTTSNIWNNYYKSQQNGDWVGNNYPTEPLIRFISNLRKDPKNKKKYFMDEGKEIKIRSNFSGKALEIGFGTLANLLFLKKKGFSCTGLEVSKDSVLRAKKFIMKNKINKIKTMLWKNSPTLPFKNSSFTIIVGLQCVYYNLDIKKFIKEVKRVLRPGGIFFFSFFSNKHEYIKYSDVVNRKLNLIKWSNEHPNYRIRGSVLFQAQTKNRLKILFKAFKKVKIFTYEFDQLPMFQSWWYINGKK